MKLLSGVNTLLAPSGQTLISFSEREVSRLIDLLYGFHFDRNADPAALNAFRNSLRHGTSFQDIDRLLASSAEAQVLSRAAPLKNTGTVQIAGTGHEIDPADWHFRREARGGDATIHRGSHREFEPQPLKISVICSLYRGRDFVESYLRNITSQSIFDRCELIVVDANSPDGEGDVVLRWQDDFPNIIYHRVNHRISIYDAWNLAIEMARGELITNANLDDVRHTDSLQIQEAAFDEDPECDIVYQNYYYTLEPNLCFDVIAGVGYSSDLPEVSFESLLQLNSPHNAPMWRRRLHDELGLFEARFTVAGDWEFWLRCLTNRKVFRLIREPHVAYYVNPNGLSASDSVKVAEEMGWVRRRYKRTWDAIGITV